MTLRLNIFLTSQSPFVPFRKFKLQYKLLRGVTLRREAKDYYSQALNFWQPMHSMWKGYATHKPLPIRETTTYIFTPKGLAFEQSDSYLSLGKKGSSNKKVNKKFIKFFKYWYFDMAPIGNKQVREDSHSSLLVLPSYNLKSKKAELLIPSLATLYRVMATSAKDSAAVDHSLGQPTLKSALTSQNAKEPVRSIGFKSARAKSAVVSTSKWGGFSSLIFTPPYAPYGSMRLQEALPKGGDGLSLSTVGKGLIFKPAPHRGGSANTKLYFQNTLRGEWFLLKKVTGLKNYLTTFVNQANNPAVKLSDKKLNARGLEAKTTNLNSILSFWLLSFVAFIIRLKLENPDLNLFLAHYPFGVSSVTCMIKNINVTPKGIEASKIKAVLLLPKTGNSPFLTPVEDNPPSQSSGSQMLCIGSGSDMEVKGVMHEHLQHILLTARVKLLKQNNQIEPGLHLLVPKVGTLSNYTKVSKLTLSPLGIKRERLDQYYGYSFCRVSPTPYYPTMLRMPNHPYSKKLSQEEYLLFKKSQEESLFFKSPGVMSLRSKLAPDLVAYNGTYFPTPEGVNTNHSNTTQTTKMYIKASYLLSNLVKAQAFNNGYCFSYLPPVTKVIQNLNKESPAKKNSFKKRVQKNKMSIKSLCYAWAAETSVYNFIANGLATVSTPSVLVDKKEGLYLAKSNKEIGSIHATHQATPSLVINRYPNVWGSTKLIESTPGLLFTTGDDKVINSDVSLERTSAPSLSLGIIERRTNKTFGTPFLSSSKNEKKEEAKPLTYDVESITAMHNPMMVGPTSKVAWPAYPDGVDTTSGGRSHMLRMGSSQINLKGSMNSYTPKGVRHKMENKTSVFTQNYVLGAGRRGILGLKSENLFGVRALSGGWSCFKLDSVKSSHEYNLLPLTPYVEGILFSANPWRRQPHSRTWPPYPDGVDGSQMLYMGSGSSMGVKRLGGVSPRREKAPTFKMHKQALFTYSKGLVEDTLHVFLFRAAPFFQTLLWDINIYNVLWLKSLIIKNVDLTFKNHFYDTDYLRSSSPPPLNTLLLAPTYESSHNLLEAKRGTYAKTDSIGMKVKKNRSPQHKPGGFQFVEGQKAGNTKLLRSFMLLMNHKKFLAKKKLTPFSINLELSFNEALSSKMGKRLSTVYEMRKLEKQEYRAQKENIEAMSARPKKRKRFYPRPDWLRVRLYETLLTPPLAQPTIKPNKQTPTGFARVVQQGKNASAFFSSSKKEKKTRGGFREKRSMPFYLRGSNGWGGHKNSLLLPSPIPKGIIGTTLDRGNLITRFQALFKFNPFTLDSQAMHRLYPFGVSHAMLPVPLTLWGTKVVEGGRVQVENNINQKVVSTIGSSDSSNRFNDNIFRVWFFNTFYNFDSSNFLEVNNLSMLRIFWCLNQTNVCSITSFRDTKPNPEIWLNTFSQLDPGFAIDAKKKADSVFKGFTPFASQLKKMSPNQIRARFASSKIHTSLLASSTPRGVTKSGANPSFSWKAWFGNKNNENKNNDKRASLHKGMQTYATNNLTGGLSSFFHDPMLPPLKQGDKKQTQKKKRRKEVEGNEVPHVEENPGFNNRDNVWWNQKSRELAENNKTKFLIRELSIKISNLTHVFLYSNSNFLSNQSKDAALLTLPPVKKINPTVMSAGLREASMLTNFAGPGQSQAAGSPEGTGSMGLLPQKGRILPQREELIFNLTKYRQKQQKLNYLGFIPYSFEQPKGLNLTHQSRALSGKLPGKTRFNMTSHLKYKNSIFEKKRLSPFYASSGLIKEYAAGEKKQMLEKKATSKFWWLKNVSFKALYAQHRVPNSGKIRNANSTNYNYKGFLTTIPVIHKAEATTMLHVMHGRMTGRDLVHSSGSPTKGRGSPYSNKNENKPLPLLTWLTSLSQPSPIVFSTVRKDYTTSSLNETSSWVVSATSNLTKPLHLLPPQVVEVRHKGWRSQENLFISLSSMATTVFFHFGCFIGLLSISQVRCAIKFYFILFYKLSKSYIELISSLYGWTFQYPLSFFHPLSHYDPGLATYKGRINAFFKYSKGLVLTKSFTVGYLHTYPYATSGRMPLPSLPQRSQVVEQATLGSGQASAVLPASTTSGGKKYSQIGGSMIHLVRSRLRSGSISGNMKNSPWLRYNILVWLNKKAVFLVATIQSVLPEPLSWKGKKEIKLLPALTSLVPQMGKDTGKAELALFNKFFVLFYPLRGSKQSFMLAAPSIKQLFVLQLKMELLNAKNVLSFIRNNSIKTMVTVLQKSKFLFIKSVSLLVFFLQDCFEAVLRFFENPTELSLDFFAYTFLVELYSDSLSIMPEVMDLTIWNWFQKTTGSLKTSLFFGNLLQRRFFCFFYILLNTLNQPDTALIRQQVKGSLFWDLWADLLIKTVASENQLDVSSLARLEEERTSLVDSLLFEAEVGQLPSLFYPLLPFLGDKVREGVTKPYNTKFLHLTKIKHTFLNSAGSANPPLVNPLELNTDSSRYTNPKHSQVTYYPTPYRVNKESKAGKRWGANQHVSYQQIDTDLFVDLNVSKSFSHVSGIKYYAGVQYPIGSLVCQIYTGLFETQAAKNVLVIGPASASTKTFDAKSLLIQALAGETEIKIIIDNAARYTLVNRGLAVGIRLLKEVFNAIALQTPCFFLLEDVHLIGEKRLLLISDSSDAKKILNNQMPLSHIDALEVHEKNQVMIQYSKQAVTHYKKPYRDSAEQSIATSQYCFDFFLGNKKKKSNLAQPSKRVKGTSLPSPIPIINLSLNQSNSTKQKLKPKKFLNEISFEENSKEPELILMPRINYSVRLKVALLAQHTLSNFSAKVDMITDLLVIIDNVRSNKGFVVFATTNRAHRLDPALRRPGRLDETIRVPFLPTASARWEILKSNLGVFFKSTFSPFNVKRSVCLDLIEFTNFSIQVNSSLIISLLPPFYPFAGPSTFGRAAGSPERLFLPGCAQVGVEQRLVQDQPLPSKLYLSHGRIQPHRGKVSNGSHMLCMGSGSGMGVKEVAPRIRIKKGSPLTATLLAPKGLVASTSKSPTGVRYFNTPKKAKIDLLGDIGFERVKIMAYCKVAKKLILNSTVVMGSYMGAGCAKPNCTTTHVYLPSVYAKGNTLYWNSITLQEKTFITTEQKKQHFAIVGTTPLQLSGGSQNAKDARNTFLDLDKSEGEWEIPQNTTDAALSISTVKRKLLNLFASKVAESFVCELFCVNQKHAIHESQSLVGGLGRKSVGFFNAFTLDNIPSNDWKKASSLVKSFLQKRYMYNKNTIVNSLLCVANGSFVGEFKDEPTNPPHSVILAPSKRYENYKKIFEKYEKKVCIKFSDKLQLHEQQNFIKNLYVVQNSKGDGPGPNTPVGTRTLPPYPSGVDDSHMHSMGSNKNMKWGQNPMNQGNAGQTFRPGLAVTDPDAKESNINNSIDGNYSKLSSVNWYYNASIIKRHQFYLTNQWFNGQLAEHNAETVFLSDVDWRLTFIEELGDISIDFPDADQLYNPRHRRWLLNTSSLSGGTASSWHTFYNYDQEISDHLVMQAFNKIYVLLNKNREKLDALSYKLIKTGFLKELHFVKLVL